MKKIHRKITAGRRKGILFLVSLLAGTGIYFVAEKTMQMNSSGIPVVQPIRALPYSFRHLHPYRSGSANNKERAAIKAFQKWIDSIKNDPAGRLLYDSICRMRPGLLDSVTEAARYYSLQNLLK